MNCTDLFVIGGGPAGLAAALAARKRGLDVTVADSLAPPIDKACGEGLMPDGVAALQELDIDVAAVEGHSFRGIRFVSCDLSCDASFPSGTAFGARRTKLHSAMVERANVAGVKLLWQAVVSGIGPQSVTVNGKSICARWIVGADGGQSQVRRWAGLDQHICMQQRYAFRRHYNISPWTDFMELHWGAECQLYITPVGRHEICAALISRDPRLRLDEALGKFPQVKARLAMAGQVSTERGAVSVSRKLGRVCSGNVALIGDAAGGVDAITGEGLCIAFRQATILADCLAKGTLAHYHSEHRKLMRRPALMARGMLLLEHPRLRARVMQAFASRPELFARMLATHVGHSSPIQSTANGLALGWKLLTA